MIYPEALILTLCIKLTCYSRPQWHQMNLEKNFNNIRRKKRGGKQEITREMKRRGKKREGNEWINNEPLLYRIQRLYKWGKRPKNILYGIWHFSFHMCQFSQKLALTSMMVSSNCQKHSEAWTEGERDGGVMLQLLCWLVWTLLSTASGALTTKRKRQRGKQGERHNRKDKEETEATFYASLLDFDYLSEFRNNSKGFLLCPVNKNILHICIY